MHGRARESRATILLCSLLLAAAAPGCCRPCEPESDWELCLRFKADCGWLARIDNCGSAWASHNGSVARTDEADTTKTVSIAGYAAAGALAGAGIVSHARWPRRACPRSPRRRAR